MPQEPKSRLVVFVSAKTKKEIALIKKLTGLSEEDIFDLGLRYIRKKAEFEKRKVDFIASEEAKPANGHEVSTDVPTPSNGSELRLLPSRIIIP